MRVPVYVPRLVERMHRSSKTRPPASVAKGTADAVILFWRNHGDSPFSDVLCLLASLSKDVAHTKTHTHGLVWGSVACLTGKKLTGQSDRHIRFSACLTHYV